MTRTGLRAAAIGSDEARVAAYVSTDHETYARLFLPAIGPEDHLHSWHELARMAGIAMTNDLRWSSLQDAQPPAFSDSFRHAEGRAHLSCVEKLTSILRNHTSTPEHFYHAMWDGEPPEHDTASDPFPPQTADLQSRFGGLNLHCGNSEWMTSRTRQMSTLYPVFWWSADGSFLVSSPIYHDSLYVSGSGALIADLQVAGFEILTIAPDVELPSEGD